MNNCNHTTINCNNIRNDCSNEFDDFVVRLIREHVFSKIKKKKPRYNSEIRFNTIINESSKDDVADNDNYYDDYDDNNNNFQNNIYSSYAKRTIKKIKIY